MPITPAEASELKSAIDRLVEAKLREQEAQGRVIDAQIALQKRFLDLAGTKP